MSEREKEKDRKGRGLEGDEVVTKFPAVNIIFILYHNTLTPLTLRFTLTLVRTGCSVLLEALTSSGSALTLQYLSLKGNCIAMATGSILLLGKLTELRYCIVLYRTVLYYTAIYYTTLHQSAFY